MTDAPPIRRSPVAMRDCNLARSFELIGDRWTLLILRSALYGVRRFDDFQADLDLPRSVLSNRLAALVESGIMERRGDPGKRRGARGANSLTRKGGPLGRALFSLNPKGGRRRGGRA